MSRLRSHRHLRACLHDFNSCVHRFKTLNPVQPALPTVQPEEATVQPEAQEATVQPPVLAIMDGTVESPEEATKDLESESLYTEVRSGWWREASSGVPLSAVQATSRARQGLLRHGTGELHGLLHIEEFRDDEAPPPPPPPPTRNDKKEEVEELEWQLTADRRRKARVAAGPRPPLHPPPPPATKAMPILPPPTRNNKEEEGHRSRASTLEITSRGPGHLRWFDQY